MLPLDGIQFWGTESCSDASVLQSLWDAEMLASLIIYIHISYFYEWGEILNAGMLRLAAEDPFNHPPPKHTHTHRKSEETSCYASAVHQGNQTASDSCWRNWEKERVGRARSSFWFSRSLLLEPSDVIQVTYSSQTTPASSWQPIGRVVVWMSRSVPCGEGVWVEWSRSTSLVHWEKKKREVEKKLCWLPWQQLWIELKWVCMLISLFVTHVGSVCIKVTVSVCFTLRVCCWIYIINRYCMIARYRRWECNGYCFIIIAL